MWQHVLKHVNLQPLASHGVDFSRVRMWNLNNWARLYRQTLVFSSIQDPQISAVLTKHCANYRGQVTTVTSQTTGIIVPTLLCVLLNGRSCRFMVPDVHQEPAPDRLHLPGPGPAASRLPDVLC